MNCDVSLKVLGLIPARFGSKSVHRKNLTDLGGSPLIGWSIRSALESNLDRVVVSTDDPEISRVSQSFGAEVPFLRPQNLALDHSLTIDTVLHALDELGPGFDAVMLLQPTSPFRNATDINDALNLFIDCSSVISVVPVDGYHPARMKVIENGFLVDPSFGETEENTPRQNLQPLYIRNGAIYLSALSTLVTRSFKGPKSRPLIMPRERSLNIDSPFELELARAMLAAGLF